MTKQYTQDDINELINAINDAWDKAYQGERVTDIFALKSRVLNLSLDRECWIFNARVSEKECQRLRGLYEKNDNISG